MDTYQFGDFSFTWLKGGTTNMDGGAMFGVVPKALWSKRYPVNDNNQIELPCDPLLIQTNGHNILLESGLNFGKFDDKKKRNYGITDESRVEAQLGELGLTAADIDIIMMTHLHFDHASGLTTLEQDGSYSSTFPNAKIFVSEVEWNEMKNPNIRSRNTYWKENWQPIEGQVVPFTDSSEVIPGIEMIHTGGHSNGHSIVKMEQNGETIIHFADLMPTHAHQSPLWVLAYDDYPMTSVFTKDKWVPELLENGYWASFYHDTFYRLVKWSKDGKEIVESVKRTT
ncbi:MBL fold metallo-hydrolase [Chryseomicrobium palamuruense]|uniref:MBL fold metallo-hydrolase n=1 Tax=Chryseomicrobium palamuruense TaxID=682973 RepID=A0ABV8UY15_9BACL